MFDFLRHLTHATQTERARPDQVANHAGGFVFALDPWQRLERFLVLGCEGGTFYACERTLVVENAKSVDTCLSLDPERTVRVVAEISFAGRAPKNDAAIFALAMAMAHPDLRARRAAFAAVNDVCRTGTHLFQLVTTVKQLRGTGRGLRSAVARWYASRSASDVAFQMAKYGQREGMSHRDVLRLVHAAPPTEAHAAAYRWATHGEAGLAATVRGRGPIDSASLPAILSALEAARRATTTQEIVTLVREHGISHEMIPTRWKSERAVWEALFPRLPLGALLRNVATLTRVGLFRDRGALTREAASRLVDPAALRKARIHPLAVLSALVTYKRGVGVRSDATWTPLPELVGALDHAFHEAFSAVDGAGKRFLLAVDVSGSMGWHPLAGVPGVTPALGAAAMALVTRATEPFSDVVAFSTSLVRVPFGPQTTVSQAQAALARIEMGSTDCAAPIVYATKHRVPIDVFVVYTDNETYAGSIHPFQALRTYRERMGIAAKLVVVGMTSTGFSIADPSDGGMLDLVGFDTTAPAVMTSFAAS